MTLQAAQERGIPRASVARQAASACASAAHHEELCVPNPPASGPLPVVEGFTLGMSEEEELAMAIEASAVPQDSPGCRVANHNSSYTMPSPPAPVHRVPIT